MEKTYRVTGAIATAKKLLAALVFHLALIAAVSYSAERAPDPYEARVLAVMSAIQSTDLERARELSAAFIHDYPTSRIGAVLLGDAYTGSSSPLAEVAARFNAENSEQIQDFRQELVTRARAVEIMPKAGQTPAAIVDMGDASYVMLGDMENSRLYVYQNVGGTPELVAHYYMAIGSSGAGKQVEGDLRTPIGVYQITHFIADKELPDLYGSGAFPVDYPNVFDKGLKRTGYGIWLHGTPSDRYSRVPYASEGCFVVSNRDFEDIAQYIEPDAHTPVVLSDHVEWVSRPDLTASKDSFMEALKAWELAWESLNVERYAQQYNANKFKFSSTAFSQWIAGRCRAMRSAEFIRLDVSVKGLYAYPGEEDTMLVVFEQVFESDTYQDVSQKQMYWQRDTTGQWRVIYEGDV